VDVKINHHSMFGSLSIRISQPEQNLIQSVTTSYSQDKTLPHPQLDEASTSWVHLTIQAPRLNLPPIPKLKSTQAITGSIMERICSTVDGVVTMVNIVSKYLFHTIRITQLQPVIHLLMFVSTSFITCPSVFVI